MRDWVIGTIYGIRDSMAAYQGGSALEALAAVVLIALMLVPLANIGVGLIAGFVLFGGSGAIFGGLAGLIITLIEVGCYENSKNPRVVRRDR